MKTSNSHPSTLCVHAGTQSGGQNATVSPIYHGTSYPYLNQEAKPYPRYFNTENQRVVVEKLCSLEGAESGLVFASGMAAISTTLLTLLKPGDHAVVQQGLYGGTSFFMRHQFDRLGIAFDFTRGLEPEHFAELIQDNTRLIYLETPNNPLLTLTDIAGVTAIARERNLLTLIDNTFASPVNQQPIQLGIDLVLHSATKYLSGHSDLTAGFVVGKKELIGEVLIAARSLGGSLEAQNCALLERSMKTLALRVKQQNSNALILANFLENHPGIIRVNYPGLTSHPQHELARRQMLGFGGMLSFELAKTYDPTGFQHKLALISPSMSLGGVETTICAPTLSSHAALTSEQQRAEGIHPELMRLSVGIEEADDLIRDLEQALQ